MESDDRPTTSSAFPIDDAAPPSSLQHFVQQDVEEAPTSSTAASAGDLSEAPSSSSDVESQLSKEVPENEELCAAMKGVSMSRKKWELPPELASCVIPISGTLSRPRRRKVTEKSDYKRHVRDRLATLCMKNVMADVVFTFDTDKGTEALPAHTCILAVSSQVFKAMFDGNFTRESEIHLPDADVDAFRTMLNYIYSDAVSLSQESVLSVLYLAKKYMVDPLREDCIAFLAQELNASNVCNYLTQSTLFEQDSLMDKCWSLIDAQTELVLASEAFSQLSVDRVLSILKRNTLTVKEVKVFNAASRWAEAECSRRSLPLTTENLRSCLQVLLPEIRLPTMPLDDFANGPAQSALLTFEEKTGVFLHLASTSRPTLPFKTRRRVGLKLRRCQRFNMSACRINQWRYRGRCDSIQFSVDERIFVVGFGLYGSSGGPHQYKVVMALKRLQSKNDETGTTLAEVPSLLDTDGSSNIFPVLFPHPIQVDADQLYTASVTIDGKKLSFFGQEGQSEVVVDMDEDEESSASVCFCFHNSPESKNGTGVQGGQIPEILFYV